MKTYEAKVISGQVCFDIPVDDIVAQVKAGGALAVLNSDEYHTQQQRAWYKGVCLRQMSDETGYTRDECDLMLKAACNGNELLKKEKIYIGYDNFVERLTIVGVGKKNFTRFIENILAYAITNNLPITPPERKE